MKPVNLNEKLKVACAEQMLNKLHITLYHLCTSAVYAKVSALLFSPCYIKLESNLFHKGKNSWK